MSNYKWQGEPVDVEFGNFHAKPDPTKPLMWFNFECETDPNRFSSDGSCAIPALRFTYGGQVHIIANHYGIGCHKLRHGGWPSHQHFSFGDGRFIAGKDFLHAKGLREKEFAAHEAERERWMRKADPVAYKRIQSLREAIRNNRVPK